MLIRKQLLFPQWFEDYLKDRAAKTGQSEGELVRGLSCIGVLHVFSLLGRKRVDDIDERIARMAKEILEGKHPDEDKVRIFFDDLYYATRKLLDEATRK